MTQQIQQPFGTLFIISGPSGAGKTTVLRAVLAELKREAVLSQVVTYTTKQPRPGDVPGTDYHFVTAEEFQGKIAAGFFLEYSTSYAAYYGTPASIIEELRQGTSLIAVLDYNGVKALNQAYHKVVSIWLGVAHESLLAERLARRGTETDDHLQLRLALSQEEAREERERRLFNYYLVNNEVAVTAKNLCSLIRYELSRSLIKNVDI